MDQFFFFTISVGIEEEKGREGEEGKGGKSQEGESKERGRGREKKDCASDIVQSVYMPLLLTS